MWSTLVRSGALAAGALALLVGPAQSQDKTTLRLDWTALGYHAPFYLGVSRGYYRDAGLDVSVLEGKGSPAVGALVGNGSDDFGFADASTIAQLVSQGLPAKMVMGIFQKSTLALFFPAGKGNLEARGFERQAYPAVSDRRPDQILARLSEECRTDHG